MQIVNGNFIHHSDKKVGKPTSRGIVAQSHYRNHEANKCWAQDEGWADKDVVTVSSVAELVNILMAALGPAVDLMAVSL